MKNDGSFCKKGGGSSLDAKQQKQIEEHAVQINEMKNALDEKVDKSNLIEVHSLGGDPLFMAPPVEKTSE